MCDWRLAMGQIGDGPDKTLEPNKTLGASDALEAFFTGASPLPGYTGAAPDSVVTRISIGISISILISTSINIYLSEA